MSQLKNLLFYVEGILCASTLMCAIRSGKTGDVYWWNWLLPIALLIVTIMIMFIS